MPRKPDVDKKGRYHDVFPSRLRGLLEETRTTQQEIKDVLKVNTRQAVTGYIDGTTQPTIDKIQALSKHFNVSADYLLGLSDNREIQGSNRESAEYTGLTENAVDVLHGEKEMENTVYLKMLSAIISDQGFFDFLERCTLCTHKAKHLKERPEDADIVRYMLYDISDDFRTILNRIFPIDDSIREARKAVKAAQDAAFESGFDEEMSNDGER